MTDEDIEVALQDRCAVRGFLRGARGDFQTDIDVPSELTGRALINYLDEAMLRKYGEDAYGMITEYNYAIVARLLVYIKELETVSGAK